jgi:enoyl-CoA hydratase/carnithine racemase
MIEERPLNGADAPALLAEWTLNDGRALGVVTLNVAKTLNSLSLEMIDLMDAQLAAWAEDPRIAALYLRGAGDRAFCAGGDIQALYRAIKRNHEAGEVVDPYAETFFEREYRLDHRIHVFPKPVVCFGHGVVMGGGLGLLSASSHRVVTPSSRIGMPEITIGLFPDAGGTALLSAMPGAMGVFLGLTGAHINGTDALELGLGSHLVADDKRGELEDALVGAEWQGKRAQDDLLLDRLLAELDESSRDARPESKVEAQRPRIDAALADASGDYAATIAGLRGLVGENDWVDGGVATLEKGCPVTAGIVVEQLHRARDMKLADMFRMEMVIGTHCARNRDFAEGVRALLIDKDRTPAWSVPELDALSPEVVEAHFQPPWDRNPLADLH